MGPERAAADGALEQLLERRSVPALLLHAPGPSSEQIARAIDAALCAPDHGALRPARFVLIEGEARERLARLFLERLQAREPTAPPGKLDKAYRQPLCAPLVIAVAARLVPEHKVPETEQLLSTTYDLDRMSSLEIVTLMNHEDATVAGAVERALPQIARAIDVIARGLRHGGRLIYVGITADELKFRPAALHKCEGTLFASRNALPGDFTRIINLIETSQLDTRPWITHRAAFDELIDVFPSFTRPETGVIKAVVSVGV